VDQPADRDQVDASGGDGRCRRRRGPTGHFWWQPVL
jgi:hypothetical protein